MAAKHDKNKAQVHVDKHPGKRRVLVVYGTGKRRLEWRDK